MALKLTIAALRRASASEVRAARGSKHSEILRAWQRQALNEEDKTIVEAIEQRGAYVRANGLRPAMLSCDEAAVRVSREIERLERLETTAASQAVAA